MIQLISIEYLDVLIKVMTEISVIAVSSRIKGSLYKFSYLEVSRKSNFLQRPPNKEKVKYLLTN